MKTSVLPLLFAAALSALSLLPAAAHAQTKPPPPLQYYDYTIVRTYPHDPQAFTQGLLFRDGYLYESTGLNGRSSIRKVNLEDGRVLKQKDLPAEYFGEGMTDWKNELISITWQSQKGFVFDLSTFELRRTFTYPGEGWGLARDGRELFMSDGSATVRVLDPATFKEKRRISVTANGVPVQRINELEWIAGELYANLWQSDLIARIDPASGKVVGVIDLSGLLQSQGGAGQTDVLNGIAYDAVKKRLFVTGKLWPTLFEIKLVPRAPR